MKISEITLRGDLCLLLLLRRRLLLEYRPRPARRADRGRELEHFNQLGILCDSAPEGPESGLVAPQFVLDERNAID